ncbi:hypothetical protein HMPREF1564_2402 [Providencia alcalifaciens R90-1475]|nr:hypothetical protein HMPREF1564_2402 [Providencia alcalifaciens R90-1475]
MEHFTKNNRRLFWGINSTGQSKLEGIVGIKYSPKYTD